jgi:hypothetical protein
MIAVQLDYATPSAFDSTRERALLGLTADGRRPVRLHARVARDVLSLRLGLQTLGQLVWSSDEWRTQEERLFVLDPVITVHPDRVFFEAFSQDRSAYGQLIVDRALLDPEGEVRTGTTNVDFTAWLWAALAEMRSARETWLRIEAGGLEVATVGAGGRFERKVDLPDDWVRAFLELQGAMTFPGTRLSLRPVDLLSAIRVLRYTKAKTSPRALRYEMTPGEDARIVLEPWEHLVPLKGARHSYTEPRTIRTWGRRRLRLIEPLLPYADSVDVYLKGRALPSFYVVKLPGVTFVLGLSGWTENNFTASGFHLLGPTGTAGRLEAASAALRETMALSVDALAARLGVGKEEATALGGRLVRLGRAIYDVERREYRSRELFAEPLDEARFYPPDVSAENASRWLAEEKVKVASAAPRETRKTKSFWTPEGRVLREVIHRDWVVDGTADGQKAQVVIGDGGQLIFGQCGCRFFEANALNLGPCAHLLALYRGSETARKDLPTSVPATEAAPRREREEPEEDEEEGAEEEEDDGADEEDAEE